MKLVATRASAVLAGVETVRVSWRVELLLLHGGVLCRPLSPNGRFLRAREGDCPPPAAPTAWPPVLPPGAGTGQLRAVASYGSGGRRTTRPAGRRVSVCRRDGVAVHATSEGDPRLMLPPGCPRPPPREDHFPVTPHRRESSPVRHPRGGCSPISGRPQHGELVPVRELQFPHFRHVSLGRPLGHAADRWQHLR